eukprot:TRINITY_DN25767_c0_g1_i1.p1 TRINITY_DN25767_c0_g1~~TRINITY_DN25767_c0_g1_i1.p1  ORF type:complete len:197 (-),score=27.00 TRINITY_DN25767_c0_g1_i1:327-917(-)
MVDPNDTFAKLSARATPGMSWTDAFLSGFSTSEFQKEINTFISNRAGEFCSVNVDGSDQLSWQEYHTDYRCIFENQTELILKDLEISADDFASFCQWLKTHSDERQEDTWGIYAFLEVVNASEDYQAFLTVMFAEAQKQQGQAQGQQIELDVPLPENAVAGQAIAIEYLGNRYEVIVPEGVSSGTSGTSFRAAVVL